VRSPSVERLSRSSSSARTRDSAISKRSPSKGPSLSRSSRNQDDGRPIGSSVQGQQRYFDVRRVTPRSTARSEVSDSRGSQRSPSTANRASSSAPTRQAARPTQRLTQSRRSLQAPTRQSAASSRRAAPPGERASSQRQPKSRSVRSPTTRKNKVPGGKDTDRTTRRRGP
jgi:hypothetical protein